MLTLEQRQMLASHPDREIAKRAHHDGSTLKQTALARGWEVIALD